MNTDFVDAVANLAAGLGVWSPIVLLVLLAGQVLAVPVPAGPFMIGSVVAFGPWAGFALNLAGTVVGSVAAFLLGRRFGWPIVRRLAGKRVLARLERLGRRGPRLGGDGRWLPAVLCLPVPAGGDVACLTALGAP